MNKTILEKLSALFGGTDRQKTTFWQVYPPTGGQVSQSITCFTRKENAE